MSAGGIHSLFVDLVGSVYSCGHNGYGQLGIGDTNDRILPTRIVNLPPNKLACGQLPFIIFGNDGTVRSCGNNLYGQLGLNNNENKSLPTLIDLPEITSMASGYCQPFRAQKNMKFPNYIRLCRRWIFYVFRH